MDLTRKSVYIVYLLSERSWYSDVVAGSETKERKVDATMVSQNRSARSSTRDLVIIVSSLVVILVGYFLFKERQEPPQPPQQATMAPHGMGGSGFLEELPTDYDGLVQTGHQYMDAGDYAVAAECYKRALVIDGSSADVRTDFGACLHGMGLPERALQEFDKVLQGQPSHVVATFNKGVVLLGLNRPDSARVWFQKVLTLDADPQMVQRAEDLIRQIGS